MNFGSCRLQVDLRRCGFSANSGSSVDSTTVHSEPSSPRASAKDDTSIGPDPFNRATIQNTLPCSARRITIDPSSGASASPDVRSLPPAPDDRAATPAAPDRARVPRHVPAHAPRTSPGDCRACVAGDCGSGIRSRAPRPRIGEAANSRRRPSVTSVPSSGSRSVKNWNGVRRGPLLPHEEQRRHRRREQQRRSAARQAVGRRSGGAADRRARGCRSDRGSGGRRRSVRSGMRRRIGAARLAQVCRVLPGEEPARAQDRARELRRSSRRSPRSSRRCRRRAGGAPHGGSRRPRRRRGPSRRSPRPRPSRRGCDGPRRR